MFAGDRTAVFLHEREYLGHEIEYLLTCLRLRHIRKRDDVEVAITHMARDRIDEAVATHELIELGEEGRVVLWMDRKIIDERGSIQALHVLAQQGKALATDLPVLGGLRFVLGDLGTHCKSLKSSLRRASLVDRLVLSVFGKLRHEDEFRYPAGERHEHLR